MSFYFFQGFVVVETNFRVYAYSTSKLHCEILRLFSRFGAECFFMECIFLLPLIYLTPFLYGIY